MRARTYLPIPEPLQHRLVITYLPIPERYAATVRYYVVLNMSSVTASYLSNPFEEETRAARDGWLVDAPRTLGACGPSEWMEPRRWELPPKLLNRMHLKAHVGAGAMTITRTTMSGSLFDVHARLSVSSAKLRVLLEDSLRRPPDSVLEIGVVCGELTDKNPLDRLALERVAVEVLEHGVLPLTRAVELYLDTRKAEQRLAPGPTPRKAHSTTARSSCRPHRMRASCIHQTVPARDQDRLRGLYPGLGGSTLTRASNNTRETVERRLLRNLPLARIPTYSYRTIHAIDSTRQRQWHYALLPDARSVSDEDFLASATHYYGLVAERERRAASAAQRGAALSAADFSNLRACMGGQVGELLEFLVCKGFDDAARRALGISDAAARASIARYDAVCTQLPALRREAEEHVREKVIGTTGQVVANQPVAIRRYGGGHFYVVARRG